LFDANQHNNSTHYPSHHHPQQHCTMDAAADYDRQLNEFIISKVVSDLVAKKNALDAGKKMGRKDNQYGIAVEHLQRHGVLITVDALKQRVSRSIRAQNKPTEVHVAASPSTLASLEVCTRVSVRYGRSTAMMPLTSSLNVLSKNVRTTSNTKRMTRIRQCRRE
jgi:hypothetical protein